MIASPSQTPSNHPEPSADPTSGPSATSDPTPNLSFRPTGPKLEQLLGDLLNSYGSLHDVALNNDTTLAALTLWMAMPENQTLLDQVESAGYRRARLAASNVLADAVNSLSCSLRGHVEIETKHCAHLDYTKIRIYERARTNARKAAWLLYRISRSHPALPIDAATHLKLEEARLERARLKAQLTAQSKAQYAATPNAQHKAQRNPSRSTDFGGTTGGCQSGVPSHSCATTNVVQSVVSDQVQPASSEPIEKTGEAGPDPTVTPDPSLATSSSTPSLHPSVTESLSSVALRDLRGESSSSDSPVPHDDSYTALESGATEDAEEFQVIQDNHGAALLPCGITTDSS